MKTVDGFTRISSRMGPCGIASVWMKPDEIRDQWLVYAIIRRKDSNDEKQTYVYRIENVFFNQLTKISDDICGWGIVPFNAVLENKE